MALSVSLESLYPIVRKAQKLVHTHNVVVGPRLLIRNFSSSRAVRSAIQSAHMCSSSCQAKSHASDCLILANKNGLCSPIKNGCILQHVRNVCGRENCADPCDFPPCSPENLAKTDCMKRLQERVSGKAPQTVYEVYWNRPECCANECVDAFPRFDDMYYRESDKENRVYTQTWCECPNLVVMPKPICCPDKIRLPPLCKRSPKDAPKTACGPDECPPDLATACPKIKMPCCRLARNEPCRKVKTPSDCKKFLAPSPAFSECRKPDFRTQKITECWCLAAPSMCQVWEEWRRLQKIKRVSS